MWQVNTSTVTIAPLNRKRRYPGRFGFSFVIGSHASVTAGGTSFEVDLTSVTMPLSGVPRLTYDRLDLIADRSPFTHQFFKELRSSTYFQEWKVLSSLPNRESREWKMVALSFCALGAIEATMIYQDLPVFGNGGTPVATGEIHPTILIR